MSKRQRDGGLGPRRGATVMAIVVGGALGLGGGVAYAVTQLNEVQPGGISATEGGKVNSHFSTDWPVNAAGQSYGSLLEASSPDDAPDLIQVETYDGTTGYVDRVDLDTATGANVANPEEAIAWQERVDKMAAAGESTLLPVYALDGKTVIGEFEIVPSQPDPGR